MIVYPRSHDDRSVQLDDGIGDRRLPLGDCPIGDTEPVDVSLTHTEYRECLALFVATNGTKSLRLDLRIRGVAVGDRDDVYVDPTRSLELDESAEHQHLVVRMRDDHRGCEGRHLPDRCMFAKCRPSSTCRRHGVVLPRPRSA